jgi:hypothetical protein
MTNEGSRNRMLKMNFFVCARLAFSWSALMLLYS